METPPPVSESQETSSTESPAVQQISYAFPTTDARHESEQITRGDVACIAVKLIGVYVFLQAFPVLVFAATGSTRYGRFDLQYLATSMIVPAVLCGVGVFLFARAPRLGRHLLPTIVPAQLEQHSHGPTQFHAMALSVAGLVLFAWSAPHLAWFGYSVLAGDSGQSIQRSLSSRVAGSSPTLFIHGGQAALGVWLFLGSKGLAAWWARLRHPEFRGQDTSQSKDTLNSGDDATRID
ncbi:MAG: hypothetical protein JWN24_228 [Phycisphaerales bacterium]|nr:hypothetical protein [Phycisphaerales bacterium]